MNRYNWKYWLAIVACSSALSSACAQSSTIEERQVLVVSESKVAPVQVGADQIPLMLSKLKGKRVAILGNQTSILSTGTHLVDTLLSQNIRITKIFTPEHGFRGSADAGAKVKDGKDKKTGLPIVSLYGNNKKPSAEQLKDVDIVVYDLQDVGVRFYTYISTLEYMMEACAANAKELLILDRPNPLANKVDGAVLDAQYQSFVGRQPIPVVYGMTVAEYAKMLMGESWIKASNLKLEIIPVSNYTRNTVYTLPVPPSPNLKNMTAIYLYPSLCFFEGTVVSLGRGTDAPFQMYGHPSLKAISDFEFTPQSVEGASNPPLKGQLCYGELVATKPEEAQNLIGEGLNLAWLLKAYKAFPKKSEFFLSTNFFNLLAGNALLKQQIIDGLSEQEIRATWKPGLDAFKKIRSKYLIYH